MMNSALEWFRLRTIRSGFHLTKVSKDLSSSVRFATKGAAFVLASATGIGSIVITLLLQLGPLVELPFWGLEFRWRTPEDTGLLTVAVMLFLAEVAIISLRVYRKNIPRHEFAQALLEHEDVEGVIFLVSYGVMNACNKFTRLTRSATKTLGRFDCEVRRYLDTGGAAASSDQAVRSLVGNAKKLKRLARRLQKNLVKERVQYLQLLEMKLTAATKLGLDHRRFCEDILQFSPGIMALRAEKYMLNVNEVVDLAWRLSGALEDGGAKSDIEDLLERASLVISQNNIIVEKVQDRLVRQWQLFHNRRLHADIHRLGVERSASESMKRYAHLLSAVAKRFKDRIARLEAGNVSRSWCVLRHGTKADQQDRLLRDLVYIHRKQRVHAGFDLNAMCGNLLERAGILHLADALAIVPQIREASSEDRQSLLSKLERLEILGGIVEAQIYRSRLQIRNNFRENVGVLLPGDEENVVVAIGYSKTVREVLKNEIPEDLSLVVTHGAGKEYGGRLLLEEVRESKRWRGKSEAAIFDLREIGLVLRRATNILVLMGAEVVDSKTYLLVPPATSSHLRFFYKEVKEAAKGSDVKVVCVAEDYKRLGEVAGNRRQPELKIDDFCRNHISGSGLEKFEGLTVISESGIYPPLEGRDE